MPVVSTCPQCQSSLKVPDHLVGKSVKCPKCGTILTVPGAPASTPPPIPSAAEVVANVPPPMPRPQAPLHAPPLAAAARPGSHDDDDYDDRPMQPRRRPRRYDEPDVAYAQAPSANVQMGFGIAALCVGCVAVIISLIPCIGLFIGMPIAGLGIVLGVVGLIVALVQKGRGLGFPIAGSCVNLVALLIGAVWYFWIGYAVNTGLNQVTQLAKDVGKELDQVAKNMKAEEERRIAQQRNQSQSNLKQLATAMHGFNEMYGQLPHTASDGKNGRGELSWRVALLPFLGEHQLYSEFKLNERWNSQHNSALLPRMPNIYRSPRNPPVQAGHTFCQVFVGAGPFGQANAPKLPVTFVDGADKTFLIVEAGNSVPWTQPSDIQCFAGVTPPLNSPFPDGFNAVLADGSTRFIRRPLYSDQLIRSLITPAGREAIQWPE